MAVRHPSPCQIGVTPIKASEATVIDSRPLTALSLAALINCITAESENRRGFGFPAIRAALQRCVQFSLSRGISRTAPRFFGTAIKFDLNCDPLASSMRQQLLYKPDSITPLPSHHACTLRPEFFWSSNRLRHTFMRFHIESPSARLLH